MPAGTADCAASSYNKDPDFHPTMTRYNYAGPQRIAMRTDVLDLTELYEGVYFFVNDHLGSTSVSINHNGQRTAELRYNAWGVPRWSYSDLPTQRRYTGQIWDGDTGLYFYNARYYDPAIGRFTQADTIVPNAVDPQTLNRYSYVLNNPINYTDPTGHFTPEAIAEFYGVDSVEDLWWWNDPDYADWKEMLLTAEAGDLLIVVHPGDSKPSFYRFDGEGHNRHYHD